MKNVKKFFVFVLIASAVYGMSSCHRGYGCPGNDMKVSAAKAAVNMVLPKK